jgi:7-cyano-7-deazaguanine synthase
MTSVVLLSGGLDSATCLAFAAEEGDVVAVSFDYGQRHSVELAAARDLAAHYGVVQHLVFRVGLYEQVGGSALTDTTVPVPKHRSLDEMSAAIPVTYVPARNLVFLSYALGVAERVGAQDIFVGVNALDYSGYPDCRPEFIRAFERVANLATKAAVEGTKLRIRTPLLDLTKAEIIERGHRLGVPYELTHSCYAPSSGLACGACDSCLLRKKGFLGAGVPDPTAYV